jgi:hypothetical protein
MTLVSMGDQIEEGIYPFHSRFNRAVNFKQGDRLVSVVHDEIGDGPLSIVMRDLSVGTTQDPLVISDSKVVFEGREYRFTCQHRYCSTLKSGVAVSPRFRHNLCLFGELLRTTSPPKSLTFLLDDTRTHASRSSFERMFAAQVKRSVGQIFQGDQLEGVRTLSGCGLGLTPSGDDFIAGLLIGLNLRGTGTRNLADRIFAAARSDNLFSNTFLDLARRGLLFGRMKHLILALQHDGEDVVRKCAHNLFTVGGSSGADLGTGFFMTLQTGFGAS